MRHKHALGALVRLAKRGEEISGHRGGDRRQPRLIFQAAIELVAIERIVAKKLGRECDLQWRGLDAEARGLGGGQIDAGIGYDGDKLIHFPTSC